MASAPGMLVFVRSPQSCWELQLISSTTVAQVKQQLSKLTPLPPWKQELWLGSTRLEDERTLADYGVGAESTLRLSQGRASIASAKRKWVEPCPSLITFALL